MFLQRSAFGWALLCRAFTTLVWIMRDGCSASLSVVGKTDLESFEYDDDCAMINIQDFWGALDECVAGNHLSHACGYS